MMSSKTLRVALGLAAVAALATASIAYAAKRDHHHGSEGTQFTAHLIGYNETPSINSNGVADLTLTVGTNQITFDLKYSGLSGNPVAAHVHVGQPNVAGGVSFFFCGGGGKPSCPASISGEITGTVVPADIVGPTAQGFAAGDFASVVKAIRAGVTYANMHTANFPGGEIRGQLVGGHGDDQDNDDD
jgi:CHRD domain-containing protein